MMYEPKEREQRTNIQELKDDILQREGNRKKSMFVDEYYMAKIL